MENSKKTMDKIVALCKNRGFVYPGSEIYGGLANTWDYGPLGVALKNNIKNAWLKKFVQQNKYNVGLDSAILMNPQTWVASGHLGGFSDPLMDCKECKTRHRADNLIEDFDGTNVAGWTNEEMMNYIKEKEIPCPNCGKHNFTDIRQFNLMFKTFQGVTEDSKNEIYLRPETAQGIFVNFSNIQRTSRKKVPFGVAQIGKSFRNEITPGNFIFRVREFEQMELEFFCKPGTDLEWFEYWRGFCRDWLYSLNIKEENLRLRDHAKRSFVSIQRPQQTLNISSRSVGASFGALPTEQTMTLHSTAKQAVRHLSILIRQQTRSTFRMLLSRHSVLSVFSLLLLLRRTMKKLLTKGYTSCIKTSSDACSVQGLRSSAFKEAQRAGRQGL